MENNEIINETLNELIQKTAERKILWTIVNANALRWVKPEQPRPTTVTLQRQPSPNPEIKEIYILTIQSPPKGAIQFSSITDQFLKQSLANLFNVAIKETRNLADERKIETIKNLLNGL